MKVTTIPVQKPDVVITLSWEEARILRSMMGRIEGFSSYRTFTGALFDELISVGLGYNEDINFKGRFG